MPCYRGRKEHNSICGKSTLMCLKKSPWYKLSKLGISNILSLPYFSQNYSSVSHSYSYFYRLLFFSGNLLILFSSYYFFKWLPRFWFSFPPDKIMKSLLAFFHPYFNFRLANAQGRLKANYVLDEPDTCNNRSCFQKVKDKFHNKKMNTSTRIRGMRKW